ncbi:MAG: AraC family transcriptional regulator [Vitreimonas sp.]
MCEFRPVFSLAHHGVLHHAPSEHHQRHRHRASFIAVVLRGSYVEAGDAGLLSAGEGDIVIHSNFEAHLNRAGPRGAHVLLLPSDVSAPKFGVSQAIDEIVRLATKDVQSAAQLAETTLVESPSRPPADWPEQLARDILRDPQLSLRAWARATGLQSETVSRGFRRVFGCPPSRYRASVRAHAAWRSVRTTVVPLKTIAAEHGYADQAHFSKSIARLTGRAPGRWRLADAERALLEVN